MSPASRRIAPVLLVLSTILGVAAIATNGWAKHVSDDGTITTMQGLWKACSTIEGAAQELPCVAYTGQNAWLLSVRITSIATVTFSVVAATLMFAVVSEKVGVKFRCLAAVIGLFSGLFGLIAVIVFGAMHGTRHQLPGTLHYSFWIMLAGAVLILFGVVGFLASTSRSATYSRVPY